MPVLSTDEFYGKKKGTVLNSNTPAPENLISEKTSKLDVGNTPEGHVRKDEYVLPSAPRGASSAGVALPKRKNGELEPIMVQLVDGVVQGYKDFQIPYLVKAGFVLRTDFIKKAETKKDKGPWKFRHPDADEMKGEKEYKLNQKTSLVMIDGIIDTESERQKDQLLEKGFELIEVK